MAILTSVVAYWPCGDVNDSGVLGDTTGRGNKLTKYIHPNVSTSVYRIGASNNTVNQRTKGKLAYLGIWHRRITSSEQTTLYNSGSGQAWSGISGGSLNDATAYLNINESGGSTA
jgi:hypothetical protein